MSDPPSRTSTPRSFAAQSASAEELLKSQTVGLVHLSEFRKRRAEILEQKEREAQDASLRGEGGDGAQTPTIDSETSGPTSSQQPPKKKKKKTVAKGKLSFAAGYDDDDGDNDTSDGPALMKPRAKTTTNKTSVSAPQSGDATATEPSSRESSIPPPPRRLTPNPNAGLPPPKILTKSSLRAEATARDQLRREFLEVQEAVKATEIAIPFVFYDGTNIPAGHVRMKKGEQVWLFLDRCRKVGAELGVSGAGGGGGAGQVGTGGTSNGSGASTGGLSAEAAAQAKKKSKKDTRREWARVGVDDLMMVRGNVIVPHHYEFYYFIANKIPNLGGTGPGLLFDYSNSAPASSNKVAITRIPIKEAAPTESLEGADGEPTLTKVVDRRWYERNKHIFPASLWKEYEQGKEFEEKMTGPRRDASGNAFFF